MLDVKKSIIEKYQSLGSPLALNNAVRDAIANALEAQIDELSDKEKKRLDSKIEKLKARSEAKLKGLLEKEVGKLSIERFARETAKLMTRGTEEKK